MSIKQYWFRLILGISIIIVLFNSLFIGYFVQRTFTNFLDEEATARIAELEQFSILAIDSNIPIKLIEHEFMSRMKDPLVELRLYDQEGTLLLYVKEKGQKNRDSLETITIPLISNDVEVGVLEVRILEQVASYKAARRFVIQLLGISFIGFGFVMIIGIVSSRYFSKRTIMDLEETAKMAKQLQDSNFERTKASNIKEIQYIQSTLYEGYQRLSLKQRARQELVDELVHQTRTPLTIMKMHIEGMSDGMIEMSEEEIEILLTQLQQVQSVITNISSIIETTQEHQVKNEQLEIKEFLEMLLKSFTYSFEQKNINVEVKVEKEEIYSDPYLLTQIFYNIIMNALKFSKEGTLVKVQGENSTEGYLITISDEGIGMSEEELAYIFEPYYQVNQKAYGGGGIGLTIVAQNIEKLKGKVRVHSEKGKGSTFEILLPLSVD